MATKQDESAVHRRVEDLLDKLRSASKNAQNAPGDLSRRNFLRLGALGGAAASLTGLVTATSARAAESAPDDLNEATIFQLQAAMSSGRLTAREQAEFYLERIEELDQDKNGPRVNSILEINPDALAIAGARDAERRARGPRGPLHGIPVLLKDNIDTADRMQTTAGSFALVGTAPLQDATVAAKLRAAGAVILGKTNLSEWANFRSIHSSSGWSGRGGQANNPYAIDRNPCGSSSGSGAAASANFAAVSLGTETDGSIVCPASINGVVGIKPTVGLTSRAGVVPISHNQDTVGPHARTVADAAAVLGAIASQLPDPRDPATGSTRSKVFTDYTQFLSPDGLRGARIGVARSGITGSSDKADAVFETAIRAMRDAGAIIIDPADIPTINEINAGNSEIVVLIFDFKRDLNAYLASRVGLGVHTLADLIAFNQAHADQELPFFGQELFELAESDPFDAPTAAGALARDLQIGGPLGIDAVLQQFHLDAIVAPTGTPAWTTDLVDGDHFIFASSSPSAIVGYPQISVTAGFSFGLPVGISFLGTAFSEPTLIKLASGFEHVVQARRQPKFLSKLPFDSGGSPNEVEAQGWRSSSGRVVFDPGNQVNRVEGQPSSPDPKGARSMLKLM